MQDNGSYLAFGYSEGELTFLSVEDTLPKNAACLSAIGAPLRRARFLKRAFSLCHQLSRHLGKHFALACPLAGLWHICGRTS